jgi:DNA repair protein RecO (recombination protein O)
MHSKSYSTEGIVLTRRNYGEADRIVSIYTKHFGRISFLARGVRKLTSRKRASLEVFTHINFLAHKGRGIDLILESKILESFRGIRKSLKKVSLAYFFCEVVGRITREAEKNEELYGLLLDYFGRLRKAKNLKSLRFKFIYEVLTLLGFWPRGKAIINYDATLETVLERKLSSIRVGKKLLA